MFEKYWKGDFKDVYIHGTWSQGEFNHLKKKLKSYWQKQYYYYKSETFTIECLLRELVTDIISERNFSTLEELQQFFSKAIPGKLELIDLAENVIHIYPPKYSDSNNQIVLPSGEKIAVLEKMNASVIESFIKTVNELGYEVRDTRQWKKDLFNDFSMEPNDMDFEIVEVVPK